MLASSSTPHYEHRFTLYGHTQAVTSLKFSPNGLLLASACSSVFSSPFTGKRIPKEPLASDTSVIIWNALTGVHYKTLQGHTEGVNDVAWSDDSVYVASGSDDYSVRIWNVERGIQVKSFTGHNNHVFCVNYNLQSNLLASGSFDETVKIWDVLRGQFFYSHRVIVP
ncbi:WD domain protein [Serendipita sp. 401]|nr:WD domain protein [Serendipita sp. 401]